MQEHCFVVALQFATEKIWKVKIGTLPPLILTLLYFSFHLGLCHMQSRYCTREIWSCNAGIADGFVALSRFAGGLKYRKWDWDFNLFEKSNYAILLSQALESTYGTVCWEYVFTTNGNGWNGYFPLKSTTHSHHQLRNGCCRVMPISHLCTKAQAPLPTCNLKVSM